MKKTLMIVAILLVVLGIFTGCSNDIADGDIDLDTTYFPFGLGYKWCYERHNWGNREPVSPEDTNYTWDYYCTLSVCITDSIWVEDTLFFTGASFRDTESPIKVWNDSIAIKMLENAYPYNPYYACNISVTKPEDPDPDFPPFVSSQGDTLKILAWDEWGGIPPEGAGETTLRLKGIGVVYQERYDYYHSSYSSSVDDRLLYFYNGQDTVYYASQ